jgi:hypothetical protein
MTVPTENKNNINVMTKVADIDPVGVVYNVTNTQIEEFVYDFLTKVKNIQGVSTVRFSVLNEGDVRRGIAPDVTLLLFLDLASPDVASDMNKIPAHLRRLMDATTLRASDKLYDALQPITRKFNMGAFVKEQEAYVQLDMFRVLGLMFAAKRDVHQVTVMDVKQTSKGRSVVMVAKTEVFVDRNATVGADKYARLAQSIDSGDTRRSSRYSEDT